MHGGVEGTECSKLAVEIKTSICLCLEKSENRLDGSRPMSFLRFNQQCWPMRRDGILCAFQDRQFMPLDIDFDKPDLIVSLRQKFIDSDTFNVDLTYGKRLIEGFVCHR